METKTQSSPISALINQFELQTRLFNNVLDNITDDHAHKPVKEDTNHLAWLTGHVLSSRYMLANILGIPDKEPNAEFFGNGKGIQKGVKYPSINEIRKEWNPMAEKLMIKLNAITNEELSAKAPFPVPMSASDIKAAIAFFSHHEAYTIGQMGLLRRFHGFPGMKYN
ncbi:MAG TPA: DinB family protein [Bacteroidia bacterium]|jgi:hypothetical protein|nr:DinB family protein [Bacteroidia bacterium]